MFSPRTRCPVDQNLPIEGIEHFMGQQEEEFSME
jgi:hypothetical protein